MDDQLYSFGNDIAEEVSTIREKPIQRKSAFSLVALIFVFIFSLFGTSSCESRKTIVNAIDEKEANEIVVFLASKGIESYKVQKQEAAGGGGGAQKEILWDILVNSSDALEAMSILSSQGLPRKRGQKLLELFSAGGLVPSDMQEKIRYQAGLAEQLANTIRKIDGVLDADVQLSFPEEDPLNPNAPKGNITASVYVKHQGVLDDPNSHLVTKIRRLVSSSVAGLKFDDVTVIGDRARFVEGDGISKAELAKKEIPYVRVLDIIIAKESIAKFQTLFLALIALVSIFFLTAVWVLWRFSPVIKEQGFKSTLLSIKPLDTTKKEALSEGVSATSSEEKKEEKQQEQAKTPTQEGSAQENVEQP